MLNSVSGVKARSPCPAEREGGPAAAGDTGLHSFPKSDGAQQARQLHGRPIHNS